MACPAPTSSSQDTLLHPMHREAGELERFDRVIANPPFSQNYTRSNMEFPERFRWGWCPTTGKKGDLMFAQHMLAVCKPGGMVTTVMPHGVLFRGGAEKEIRKKFLEQDLIEAIIGLPPNLFYGAGIPACILVMRPNLTGQSPNPNKPADRRGQVLFINADAEFHAGRAQNYLRPEHVEKIVSTFDRFEDVPGYARRVSLEEIGSPANDWNLNIRRYVDNSPPPEPHDVRAHLLGGVPVAEVQAKRPLFDALGFDLTPCLHRADERRRLFRLRARARRPLRDPPARGKRSRCAGPRPGSTRCPCGMVGRPRGASGRLARSGATSTPCALSFSIPSSPRSRRWACSIASSSRASSPPGGPTRCPTSRPCSKTVSRRH